MSMATTPDTPWQRLAVLINGRALPKSAVPELSITDFQQAILGGVARQCRVAALFGMPDRTSPDALWLYVVLADDDSSRLRLGRTRIGDNSFPSLTPACWQVHLFEREIAEQFGRVPVGHPWLKPVRFHRSYQPGRDAWNRPAEAEIAAGVMDFYQVKGDQIHEVAVGPVHAGIIEPGHFRFQCDGENVLHLEIALGYQHRGGERALAVGPGPRSIHYAETLAGDSTIGHATAYCQAVEALGGIQKSARAQSLRATALELERLANHVGDLGALSGDVGFTSTQAFCGRLRGEFLNMTAALCGSRFGRGLLCPGGVRFDPDVSAIDALRRSLVRAEKETRQSVELLWNSSSVMARFVDTGVIPRQVAIDLGMVGPAARACGLNRDARQNHPSGLFRFTHIPVATWESGDVFARAYVRFLEVQRSCEFVCQQLDSLPSGAVRSPLAPLAADSLAVALVEAWRGEVCHVVLTDEQGCFERYKVVDPSFHNWAAVAMALRGGQISDFPLCNKSFNLSYCGHDL